jgi:hypothetical protein
MNLFEIKYLIRNLKTIKYPNSLKPEKRENKIFLQKNGDYTLETHRNIGF